MTTYCSNLAAPTHRCIVSLLSCGTEFFKAAIQSGRNLFATLSQQLSLTSLQTTLSNSKSPFVQALGSRLSKMMKRYSTRRRRR